MKKIFKGNRQTDEQIDTIVEEAVRELQEYLENLTSEEASKC